jgi:hypothetical protein
MSENTESESVQVITTDLVYQQDKAMADLQISTAKLYPRNIQRAKKNAVDIVSMDEATAQTCTYSVPRGGRAITGPSVHLAKILAQQWGNLRIEAKVVDISATHITSEAVCFDLESNFALKTQVKRSIVAKNGRRFPEDMITVTGNAANSIALRNAILAVIPRPVVDAVYNAAIQTLTGDVSDEKKLRKRARTIVDKMMGTYAITEEQVLSAIGKASVDFITADDLAVLIGIGTSIKEGDTTIEQAFSNKSNEPIKPETATNPNERAKELITSATSLKELDQRISTLPLSMREYWKEEISAKQESFTENN